MSEPEPTPPPEPRYFTISVMVAMQTFDADVPASEIEKAAAEQIILPLSLSWGEPLAQVQVLGVVQQSSTEVPPESLPPLLSGYGRIAPEEVVA